MSWRNRCASALDLLEYRNRYPSRGRNNNPLLRLRPDGAAWEGKPDGEPSMDSGGDGPLQLKNVQFYSNKIGAAPNVETVDVIHQTWGGDYWKLECLHNYVQWLFPIQEEGVNPLAQPLSKTERMIMSGREDILVRVLRSFRMMLHFYGMEAEVHLRAEAGPRPPSPECVSDGLGRSARVFRMTDHASCFLIPPAQARYRAATQRRRPQDTRRVAKRCGVVGATTAAAPSASAAEPSAVIAGGVCVARVTCLRELQCVQKDRYDNLSRSPHNFLRITRILKFLGEMDLEFAKLAWLRFLSHEVHESGRLSACRHALENYWIETIYDDEERAQMHELCATLQQRQSESKRRKIDL